MTQTLTDIQMEIAKLEHLKAEETRAEQQRLAAEQEHKRKIAEHETKIRTLRREELDAQVATDKDANQAMVDQSRQGIQNAQDALANVTAQLTALLSEPLKMLQGVQALAEQQNSHALRMFNTVSDFAYDELKGQRAELAASLGEGRADLEIERLARQSGGKIGSVQTAWGFNVALGFFINAAPTLQERNLRRALAWYLIIAMTGQESPSVPNPPENYAPRTEWQYPRS